MIVCFVSGVQMLNYVCANPAINNLTSWINDPPPPGLTNCRLHRESGEIHYLPDHLFLPLILSLAFQQFLPVLSPKEFHEP